MIQPISTSWQPLLPEREAPKSIDIKRWIQVPSPVREGLFHHLPHRDLQAFDIALCKGQTISTDYQIGFASLKKQALKIQQEKILKEILTDNPSWEKPVHSWNEVPLEDKIWLLRLYELRQVGVEIPQIGKSPSDSTPELLKDKKTILHLLQEVTLIDWSGKRLIKCPKAICLLENLETLYLSNNLLTDPPEVSHNVRLKNLYLGCNFLTSPPDIRQNINLECLDIQNNRLSTAPYLTRNIKLKTLYLNDNQLIVPPDLTQNVNLQSLILIDNPLTIPPDISYNPKLTRFNNSRVIKLPITKSNPSPRTLFLPNTKLRDLRKS